MLENNNGRAVRQIIFRTISFRRARNTILVFLIFCCMSVLTLLGMGIAAEFEHLHATLLEWQGTDAHLILEGVTKELPPVDGPLRRVGERGLLDLTLHRFAGQHRQPRPPHEVRLPGGASTKAIVSLYRDARGFIGRA